MLLLLSLLLAVAIPVAVAAAVAAAAAVATAAGCCWCCCCCRDGGSNGGGMNRFRSRMRKMSPIVTLVLMSVVRGKHSHNNMRNRVQPMISRKALSLLGVHRIHDAVFYRTGPWGGT